MGSLGSRPTPPPSPPPSPPPYVPPPAPAPTGGTTPPPDPAAQRRDNLLRRDRGRFGTVLTSFRGLLGLADNSGRHKTLLGE